ncbi:MAG: DUF1573 domain-containing protein [Gemmataceae bacterium]
MKFLEAIGKPARLMMLTVTIFLIWHFTFESARADLHFERPDIDAGEIRGGMPVAQRFTFANSGDETIEITGLNVSCGCLKPRLDPKIYKPGQKGELVLEINPLVQSAGKHTWTAQVAYRLAGELKEQTLRVTGAIVAEVAIQPAALTVFTEHAGDHVFTLTDIREKPLQLTGVRTTSPFLKTESSEVKKNERGHWVRTITLSADRDLPDGRHEEQLEMTSNDPEYRLLRVPVTVVKRAKKRLTAIPDPVHLEGPAGRLIVIRDSEDQAILIDHVDTDSPALVCQWSKGESKAVTVKVRFDHKQDEKDKLHSAIHVHVSKPNFTILTIRVDADVDSP